METDDPCSALEKACAMLEELGDPNHGSHHRGGTGARGGPGGGMVGPPPPGTYAGGGAVPPLGNYGDRPYGNYGGGGGGGGGYGQGGYGGPGGNNAIIPLSPKNYYELHMRAMDEMPALEEYLLGLCHVPGAGPATNGPAGGPTNYSPGHSASQTAPYSTDVLYETVQYCPRVVPRLYLQICMGAVSVRAGTVPVLTVMRELGEASRCVQCPVRGLFLRYYLLMALKDKLPDGGAEEEAAAEEEAEVAGEKTAGTEAGAKEGEGHLVMSHVSSGEEILGASGSASEPTSPPPALPPPPPPSTASAALFPEGTGASGGDGLFADASGGDGLFGDASSSDGLFANTPIAAAEPEKQAAPKEAPAPQKSPKKAEPAAGGANEIKEEDLDPNRPGTVADSYNFILRNLLEMNRMWICIQHMPGERTKEVRRRRERERNDLRILVGSNLNRLSQLEGVTAHEYGSKILPRILEEVASCRDPLAQAYLMDCVVQAFPDEFHLETLEVFLGVCPRLREKVNVRTILNNMMERLLHYYKEETLSNGEADDKDVKRTMALNSFDAFEACVKRCFEARGSGMPPKDIVRLQGCLLRYALAIAPRDSDLVGRCISQCAKALGALQEQKRAAMMGQGIVMGGGTKKSMEIDMEEVATTELEKLLSVPLESMGLRVLNMPDFAMLLAFLPWENRKKVATSMAKSIVTGGEDKRVKDVNELEQLFSILSPLLRDEGMAAPIAYDTHDAHAGGSLISRTANLMGTLGINASPEHDDLFGGHGAAGGAMMQHAQSFGGDAQKIARFREEQVLVAKLVHVLVNEDTDLAYQMLVVVRRHVQLGGAARVTITVPAVVFSALELMRRVQGMEFPDPIIEEVAQKKVEQKENDGAAEEEKESAADGESAGEEAKDGAEKNTFYRSCRKILVFLQKKVAFLAPSNPELAFKLYLEIAVTTDLLSHSIQLDHPGAGGEFSSIAYDFLTQAFLVYEDEISESQAQLRAITSIVGSILACRTFERTDYEALITKTAQYSAKLLKKPDQCRMVCLCSRLFYVVRQGDAYQNPQRVLECLQRGLKIADACSMASPSNVQLFVEILDYYVYYYEIENPAITDKFVSGLIALINEHFDSISAAGTSAVTEARDYYGQILDRIKRKKVDEATKTRFGVIVC
ncbi:hypothetical protein ACHAWF_016309 [Thalassiosira exigua]